MTTVSNKGLFTPSSALRHMYGTHSITTWVLNESAWISGHNPAILTALGIAFNRSMSIPIRDQNFHHGRCISMLSSRHQVVQSHYVLDVNIHVRPSSWHHNPPTECVTSTSSTKELEDIAKSVLSRARLGTCITSCPARYRMSCLVSLVERYISTGHVLKSCGPHWKHPMKGITNSPSHCNPGQSELCIRSLVRNWCWTCSLPSCSTSLCNGWSRKYCFLGRCLTNVLWLGAFVIPRQEHLCWQPLLRKLE